MKGKNMYDVENIYTKFKARSMMLAVGPEIFYGVILEIEKLHEEDIQSSEILIKRISFDIRNALQNKKLKKSIKDKYILFLSELEQRYSADLKKVYSSDDSHTNNTSLQNNIGVKMEEIKKSILCAERQLEEYEKRYEGASSYNEVSELENKMDYLKCSIKNWRELILVRV